MYRLDIGKLYLDFDEKACIMLDVYNQEKIYKLQVYTSLSIVEFLIMIKEKDNDASRIYEIINKMIDFHDDVIKKLIVYDYYDRIYKCRVDFYTKSGNVKSIDVDLISLISLSMSENIPMYAEDHVITKSFESKKQNKIKKISTDKDKLYDIPDIPELKAYLKSINSEFIKERQ